MKDRLASPYAVWVLLVAATLASYLFQLEGFGRHPQLVGTAILAIAFFKVRVIGLRYMELRAAPWPLRMAFELWVVIMAIVLIALFWLG